MLDLNIRIQIVSLCFYVVLIVYYSLREKLPLLSTRCFTLMLIANGVNLFFDITTVYTITNMDIVPSWINEVAHRLFYISIPIVPVFFCAYLTFLANEQKRLAKKKTVLLLLPLLVDIIFVIVCPINYVANEEIVYSNGVSVIFLYLTVFFYFAVAIVHAFKLRLNKEQMTTSISAVLLLIIVTLVQMFNPRLLISGMGITLFTFVMFLSFENPKEHLETDTGTFNKRAFHLMLSEMVGKNEPFYVINVVIDNLATLNNRYGHGYGNVIMTEIVRYFTSVYKVRIYHSRGNTLSAIIKKDEVDINSLSHTISKRFQDEWHFPNIRLKIRAKMNIIEYPQFVKTADEICDAMNFIAQQQTNLTEACAITYMDESLMKSQKRHLLIENMVSEAIKNDGFNVVYQPIFSVKHNCFKSAEALVRLKDTTTVGFVSPEEFIVIAEEKGMIMELGAVVFEKVCRFIKEDKLAELGIDYIEVNLSGIQCSDAGLPAQLAEMLNKYKIPPKMINLEITETASVGCGISLANNMHELKKLGCSFSMDDFGTGYSNLSQMADVSYDLIKLDKSLIWPCFGENTGKPLVILTNVVNMISQLNVKMVAEGVETKEQLDVLVKAGVDYMQGYYFSKPISDGMFVKFLAEHNVMEINS